MNQFFNLKIWQIVAAIVCLSCQKLKPEKITLPDYPDLQEVYQFQYRTLGERTLEKTVSLDSEKELNSLKLDSLKWKEELSFLVEINPNKPEHIGAYNLTDQANGLTLELIEGEKSDLQKINIKYDGDDYQSIGATIHEDKDVYSHHREIEVFFENGYIKSWEISGYQKMMFKDTVRFGITGKVN